MSNQFQPYALTGSNPNGLTVDRYAVRFGGCGGKIMGSDWSLTRDQAQDLCWLLQDAFDLGKQRSLSLPIPNTSEEQAA